LLLSFDIHPDIEQARTLPARFYTDDAVYAALREHVFARSWQWLGDLAALDAPGSAAPHLLAPGLLDEPVLLTRDALGALHCLSNVCTHRGHPVLAQPCANANALRCPYHGRRFGLDGQCLGAPGFDQQVPGFPSSGDALTPLAFGSAFGLGFASLAPAPAFDDWIAPVLGANGMAELPLVHDPSRDRDYTFDAHWALYVENYLEGLHIPFLHAGLMQALDWPRYRYLLHPHGNLQLALAADGEPAFDAAAGTSERIAAYYWWLWPNLMLNFYPWGLSLNHVQPLGPARTRVVFRSYVARPELLDRGAGSALDRVEQEDEAAVEAVQRGMRSRLAPRGRYAPQHERGVHQFHRLLAAALAQVT
jgi:choline monooxygenase